MVLILPQLQTFQSRRQKAKLFKNIKSTIVHFRIGQCSFSLKYLLQKIQISMCTLCNTQLTVSHVLDECTKYNSSRQHIFQSNRLFDIRKKIPDVNIKAIWELILVNNLQYLICLFNIGVGS